MLESVLRARRTGSKGTASSLASGPSVAIGLGRHDASHRVRNPADQSLAVALAGILAAAERWEEALAALPAGNDAACGCPRPSSLRGRPAGGRAGPDGGNTASSPITAARAHLRLNDPQAAAQILERALGVDPGAIGVWGLIEIAWRLLVMIGRHGCGQQGLTGVHEIGLDEAELAELAAQLRKLHRTRAHPIGQSLRGGTQTRGALFLRGEPF